MIDVNAIATPEAYLPFMLAASAIMAVIFGKLVNDTFYHKAIDTKMAAGKIESAAELPPDKRYLYGTIVSMIMGMGAGMYLTAYVIDYLGIVGAGQWTFVIFAGVISAVAATVFILILHWGLREFLVRASDYAVSVADTAKESVSKVAGAVATANEIKDIVDGDETSE
ncbi:MAG: hypothetical protein RBR71_14270 [Gudongella sp.]|nr:hypothetical protein [Gudongella sp.]